MINITQLPVSHQNPSEVYLRGTDHVPDSDAPVLAAGDHHPVLEVEAEMEDGLAVVDQGVDHLPGLHVPHPDRAVAGPRDDHLVVVLEAQHGPSVPSQHFAILLKHKCKHLGVLFLNWVNSTCKVCRSHILIVLSRSPLTILLSSY